MNKFTACLVAALLVMYAVSDAQAVEGGEALVGGARRLLAVSKLDGSGKNAPDGQSRHVKLEKAYLPYS
ncbi:hypothetical protein ABBQ32_007707 [Trebouxia sp. C0010 RCD-2024]